MPDASAAPPEQRKWFVHLGLELYAVVEAQDESRLKELKLQALLALGRLREDVTRAGFTAATDRIIAQAAGGPDAASMQAKIDELVESHNALGVRVGELENGAKGTEERLHAAGEAEKKQAEYRWAKAAARFLIGAAIGAAIAGPLIAIVPWPQMVGEIVKNAISGASGVLATEIGDPLTKGTGRKRGDEQPPG